MKHLTGSSSCYSLKQWWDTGISLLSPCILVEDINLHGSTNNFTCVAAFHGILLHLSDDYAIEGDMFHNSNDLLSGLTMQGQVITTIGFLKEAPHVCVHGFNVYHKNRLILVGVFCKRFCHMFLFSTMHQKLKTAVMKAMLPNL